MVVADGAPRYPGGFSQYLVDHERAPGVGLLAGWRGRSGDQTGVGEPNPDQLRRYAENGCFFRADVPVAGRYYKMANRDYLEWARGLGLVGSTSTQVLALYCETLQRFRLAARGHGERLPPEKDRARIERHFDPLPFWFPPFEGAQLDAQRFPLAAVTQRPMFMYHAWGSQNRWLRQIATQNRLHVHPDTAAALGLSDDDWAELSSHLGSIRVPVRLHAGVEPGTVWTWNAVGKRRGAWSLDAQAAEGRRGFLLNHLIADVLPRGDEGRYANADPVTGQAAWYDLRVQLRRIDAPADGDSQPQFPVLPNTAAGGRATSGSWSKRRTSG
jgi:anaerobic selenocysteine-containing dehydrogenase